MLAFDAYKQLVREAETLSLCGGLLLGILGPSVTFSLFYSSFVFTSTWGTIFVIIWVVSPVLLLFLSAFRWQDSSKICWEALFEFIPLVIALFLIMSFSADLIGYSVADQIALLIFTPSLLQLITNITARICKSLLSNALANPSASTERRRVLALYTQLPALLVAFTLIFII